MKPLRVRSLKRLKLLALGLSSFAFAQGLLATSASAQVLINEFRRDGQFTNTEYIELLLTQDLTATQLNTYLVGDSTSATAAKFAAYRFNNLNSIASVFPAGTVIAIGGTTAIPTQDTTYNPVAGGTDGNWNILLQVGGSFLTTVAAGGDFASADVAWVDTTNTGTTSVDSIAWPATGGGAFAAASRVRIAAPNNGANVEFTGGANEIDSTANYQVNSPGSLGLPNGGANTAFINGLRNGQPANQPIVTTCPANLSTPAGTATSALVSATDADGTVTSIALTSPAVPGISLSGVTPASAIGGTATATLNVASNTASGTFNVTLTFTNTNATPQTAMCTIAVSVTGQGTLIRQIQGAGHISPFNSQTVNNVPGVVTGVRSNGFFMQDPNPDSDPATSEGIFVFTSTAPTVVVGDSVQVTGTVSEFRNNRANDLTLTQITSPTVTRLGSAPLPAPIVLGVDRTAPTAVINADSTSTIDIETAGTFDPTRDGIDFWESLEGMRVQLPNARAVSTTSAFGEIFAVGNAATGNNAQGGINISAGDFNPERLQIDELDTAVFQNPSVTVGDGLGTVTGVLGYSFSNFELLIGEPLTVTPGGLTPETTALAPTSNQLTVASFNLENLNPTAVSDPNGDRFVRLADLIVNRLRSPDILGLQEIQDSTGATNDGVVDADQTLSILLNRIAAVGGPNYQFRQINPVNNQDGGQPGGNIRVVFLFNPNRVSFVDRPGGTSTNANQILSTPTGPALLYSPGRIDPLNPAFNSSRKPLVGEFSFLGQQIFVIDNHFNSKGGDLPLFGHLQPPTLASEPQRIQQATIVNGFVQNILTVDPQAKVIVLGDLNDFEFSTPLTVLRGSELINLAERVPFPDRSSFNFEGNAQVLDNLLVTNALFTINPNPPESDFVHFNNEFPNPASDHDPIVARFTFPVPAPAITSFSPVCGQAVTAVTLTGSGFTGTTAVAFFRNQVAPFTVLSDTQLSTTVPAGARTGTIQLRTATGRTASTTKFQVLPVCP
ncbi:endonuclease/exonuclease/phosphatase family protein [Anthocerotibacter panamensis]|uniref:endonuclease/exonuclease/phosphatase family protein n=1 Tax=Anthocerotibacter panamensis TaxID=2857077 RepID=UPI001C407C3D|nr:endonuclease/exonuclease/phosphatase family protein [Anthocerotibacter panamensis]